jgi:cell division protein FtsZ
LYEVNQAAAIIKETAHPDVNMIFGAVIDPNMEDELRITVIATGFDRAGARKLASVPAVRAEGFPYSQQSAQRESVSVESSREPGISFGQTTIDTDMLNIPAFMRKTFDNRN